MEIEKNVCEVKISEERCNSCQKALESQMDMTDILKEDLVRQNG